MTRLRGILIAAVAWTALAATGAAAQETTPIAPAAVDVEAEERAVVLAVLSREDVRRVARIADVDLDAAASAVGALEGERLTRAADQARTLESRLEAQDRISFSATTLIIILVLVAIIIIIA